MKMLGRCEKYVYNINRPDMKKKFMLDVKFESNSLPTQLIHNFQQIIQYLHFALQYDHYLNSVQ